MHPASPAPPLRLLAALSLAVLVAHALLLAGVPIGAGPDAAQGRGPLQVRQIVAVAPQPEAVPDAPPARPRPARRARPVQQSVDAAAPPEAAPAADAAPAAQADSAPAPGTVPEPAALADAAATAASGVPAAPEASPLPATAAVDEAVPQVAAAAAAAPPVYATRVPAAATLRYEMRRGALTGEGELAWRPGPEGYELLIEGRAFGMALLGQASRGGFDAAGLAPQRFTDRRRGRDVRAANFQRDKALITWSASGAEEPLLAGAQDRLSWMVQLAAVVDADAARFGPGERVVMQVAGARGDADLWAFSVLGRDAVDVAGARIEGALALRREPRKSFDTVVEVWLDPARQHLPVRLKLTPAGGGETLEFLLKP